MRKPPPELALPIALFVCLAALFLAPFSGEISRPLQAASYATPEDTSPVVFDPVVTVPLPLDEDSGFSVYPSTSLQAANIDNDGIADTVLLVDVADPGLVGGIFTRFGTRSGEARESLWRTDTRLFAAALADFNGDGFDDLVATKVYIAEFFETEQSVVVAAGNGDGTFGEFTRLYSFYPDGIMRRISIADVNGDGRPDILFPARDDNRVAVITSTGDLAFAAPVEIAVDKPAAVVAGDFNADGRQDLAVMQLPSGAAPARALVYLQAAGGTFPLSQTFDIVGDTFRQMGGTIAATGDVSGDGIADLVTANGPDGSIAILRGIALHGLDAPDTFNVGNSPQSVSVGDLDGDGQAEIVIGHHNGTGFVSVLRGFAISHVSTGGEVIVTTGDFNDDALRDIAAVDIFDQSLKLLLQFNPTPPDTTDPVITVPDTITVEAETPANYTVSAHDEVSEDVTPICNPGSGFIAHVGENSVNCTATDEAGNVGTASFVVIGVDTTGPAVTITGDSPVEVGTPALFTASAYDNVSGFVAVSCSRASGFAAQLGNNMVTCTAADGAGNPGSANITIVGVDTKRPALSLPANITVDATGPTGAVVSYSVTATDSPNPAAPTVACSPASGTPFPIGTGTVSCTATDASGNSATGSFSVTVRGPQQLVSSLQALAAAAGMTQGDNNLDNVLKHLAKPAGNTLNAACNNLDAFIKKAGKLAAPQGPAVVAAGQRLRVVIGCN